VRVSGFSVSVDGFGGGPHQSLENPMGVGGMQLHEWAMATKTFQDTFGGEGGSTGVDEGFAARALRGIGAWILGRNMFGPIRGDWPDFEWKGWWGPNPPYHVPVFVLTHYPRPALEMEGGTVFHFVTGGAEEAMARAQEAAGGRDVRIGGGVATVRGYLRSRTIDTMHLAVAPVRLGDGDCMFAGLDLTALGYSVIHTVQGEKASHVTIARDVLA
jgi:dihydrofolate reductase